MKTKHTIIIAVLIPLISVILAGIFVYSEKLKSSRNTDGISFPIERYYESPKSFSGNEYGFVASVDIQLAYAEGKGRIILLKTLSGKPIPLFVPAEIKGFNPNAGQRYDFQTRIDGDGKLLMTNFRKL